MGLTDKRTSEHKNTGTFLSLQEACSALSISAATGRNWIRSGRLQPVYKEKRTSYFSEESIAALKKELRTGQNTALKKRRNKKYVSGNSFYNSYVSAGSRNLPLIRNLMEQISENELALSDSALSYLAADCALHLFFDQQNADLFCGDHLLLHFLNGEISVEPYDRLLWELIGDAKKAAAFCLANPWLFESDYVYEEGEDLLGLIYLSCKNIGSRKAAGSYYTPTKVVRKLISRLEVKAGETLLDPGCGTGNFLLQLPDTVPFDCIYGNDLDPVSVMIARLNMALKFHADCSTICDHITCSGYLTEYGRKDFDYIIGNPPWGYEFSDREKAELRNRFLTAAGRNIESYDVFMEKALKDLKTGGHLVIVVPEAVLNVKAHTAIRKIMLEGGSIQSLDFLGNVFDGVHCPCIILDFLLTRTAFSSKGLRVFTESRSFTIDTERKISADRFSFTATDEEYLLIRKLRETEGVRYLAGNADFALGIVTGNNKKFVSDKKTPENEMVLKGSDISKFRVHEARSYLLFRPEDFQQVAPTQLYRAPEKLFYRFISSQLVFAYDDRQTLSLNSCNIVIPRLPGLKIKYILAILNSRAAQFFFQKEFYSVKVLRFHIESIPIPPADEALQEQIIAVTDRLIRGLPEEQARKAYEELDMLTARAYALSDHDMEVIRSALKGR